MSRRKSSSTRQPPRKPDPKSNDHGQGLPPLHGEDAALWAQVTKSLTPLSQDHDRLHFGPLLDEKPDLARFGQPAPAAPSATGGGPAVENRTAAKGSPPAVKIPTLPDLTGFSRRQMRRIDSGRQRVEARLDLHGMGQTAAHVALRGFLHRARSQGFRHVLVITGKGRSSRRDDFMHQEEEIGVLRRVVPLWLGEPDLREMISGFSEAPRRLGGEGALYVRLRKNRTK